jgi:hypothetical protein
MGMINCGNCYSSVDERANICPYCHSQKYDGTPLSRRIMFFILGAVSGIIGLGVLYLGILAIENPKMSTGIVVLLFVIGIPIVLSSVFCFRESVLSNIGVHWIKRDIVLRQ